MTPPLQSLALLCLLLVACPPAASTPPPEAPPTSSTVPQLPGDRAVVVFSAGLRQGPGSGQRLGSIRPDTTVTTGEIRDGWRHVETSGEVETSGWVRTQRLGCRALREVELQPLEGKPMVQLRPGALLALTGARGDRFEVQTQGAVSVEGLIDRDDCGVGEPFVPTLPRDGLPHRLTRAARLDAQLEGQTFELPEGYRFTVFAVDRNQAWGRTDGPVVVRGQIDATALERDQTTPFDRLAEPLGYSHEALIGSELLAEPEGEPIAQLADGTALTLLVHQGDWVEVQTYGQVEVSGWLPQPVVRRVSLDHNELDPWARQRRHAPVDRDWPRDLESRENTPP